MDTVKFTYDATERRLIRKIAARAWALDGRLKRLSTEMDLAATHANGCPLRLADLLEADDFNLMHDVYGIARHLDRETGRLTDHFWPRFAAKETAPA